MRSQIRLSSPGVLIGAVASASAADTWRADWPVLKTYDRDHVEKIALPLGGIGTGTVSLGGRGNLTDWEIMNRPAKGYIPYAGQQTGPFFALRVASGGVPFTRALEGPLPLSAYEASHGSTAVNHGLPRFREVSFAAAYPLGQVLLSDPDSPVDVRLEAFNPLIPGDAEASGMPVAMFRFVLINKTGRPLRAAVCGTLPNFIGADGSGTTRDWKNDPITSGPKKNKNEFRSTDGLRGLFLTSEGVDPKHEAWGTMALAAAAGTRGSSRTTWVAAGWGTSLLDFWDDFSADGVLDARPATAEDMPFGSLTVEVDLPANGSAEATFYLTWHFPNRVTWSPKGTPDDVIGNYYTTRWPDAWAAAEDFAARAAGLEDRTVEFVRAFAGSTLPAEVKEAALFNLSTLRTQTCFRTRDGRFFGFEGSSNTSGCCWGSCTHVWNYEQATAFLFGALARSMRETEFLEATDDQGLMSFRVRLPIDRAREFGKAAADGQMGTIMKAFREWKMSGDQAWLARLWPGVKRALSFAWIKGGWDADRDGVMEGCQHNTMDVEYYGPNPQMEIWYLGALRAAEEMAAGVGDKTFAKLCRGLFAKGRAWTDANLLERRILRASCPAAEERRGRRPEPAARHGRQEHHRAGLSAGPGLSRRPARRPVHGPCLRPGLSRRSGPRQNDAREHPEVQHPDRVLRSLQLPAVVRARRRDGAAHGQLPEGTAEEPVPVLHRGHDRVRIHRGGRDALRRRRGERAQGHPRHPGPLRRQEAKPLRRSRMRAPLRPGHGQLGGGAGPLGLRLGRAGPGHDLRGDRGDLLLVERRRLGHLPDRSPAARRPSSRSSTAGLSLKSFRLGSAAPRTFRQPQALKTGESVQIDL